MAEWLLQLVDRSSEKRRAASRAVLEFMYAPESLGALQGDTANDSDAPSPFQSAVREILRQPEFPTVRYVQDLFTLVIALEKRRLEVLRKERQQDDEWNTAEVAKLGTNPAPAEVDRYIKRICVRLRRDLKRMESEPVDESLDSGMTMRFVIDALGPELLPAAPLIRHMLTEKHQAYTASAAISRMGRAALEFYPDLIAGLERNDPNGYFSKPLGILLRTAPEKIGEVLHLAGSGNDDVRINAIMSLGFAGREAIRHHPEVEARLLAHIKSCDDHEWYACASSLGEVAVTEEAVSLLLAATSPADGERAGSAISALGQVGMSPGRVVPRLIQLLAEFKESDPDMDYYGHHTRIATALSGYGANAHAAIPELLKRVWTPPEPYRAPAGGVTERAEPDQTIIELLGSFGPAAAAALPTLVEMKAELIRRSVAETPNGEGDDSSCPEFLLEAIHRIGSQQGCDPEHSPFA